METPVGEAHIITDEDGVLRGFDWHQDSDRLRRLMKKYYPKVPVVNGKAPAAMRKSLEDYFAGDIHAIDGMQWRSAGTDFQRTVWRALCDILARRIGNPKAVRAVGLANGANPNGLIAPCHRVIGANGTLTGYGGGMHRKKWLLTHEGAAFRE